MANCPCGLPNDYAQCCEPYLVNQLKPASPEVLMRSRYTAYTKANIRYIQQTMAGNASYKFDEKNAETWAISVAWLNLQVHKAYNASPTKGYVEFTATFIEKDRLQSIHELSEFDYIDNQWYYVDGVRMPLTSTAKIGRNNTCPCRSGRKFKSCHGK